MTFAEFFADFLDQHNLTQDEAADYLGVSQAAISRWKRGANTPSKKNMVRLAAYTGRRKEQLAVLTAAADGSLLEHLGLPPTSMHGAATSRQLKERNARDKDLARQLARKLKTTRKALNEIETIAATLTRDAEASAKGPTKSPPI